MNYLYLALLAMLCACAIPKNDSTENASQLLQDKNYRHHFQVERIRKRGDTYLVTVRNSMSGKRYITCDHVPDSVKVGSYVVLK